MWYPFKNAIEYKVYLWPGKQYFQTEAYAFDAMQLAEIYKNKYTKMSRHGPDEPHDMASAMFKESTEELDNLSKEINEILEKLKYSSATHEESKKCKDMVYNLVRLKTLSERGLRDIDRHSVYADYHNSRTVLKALSSYMSFAASAIELATRAAMDVYQEQSKEILGYSSFTDIKELREKFKSSYLGTKGTLAIKLEKLSIIIPQEGSGSLVVDAGEAVEGICDEVSASASKVYDKCRGFFNGSSKNSTCTTPKTPTPLITTEGRAQQLGYEVAGSSEEEGKLSRKAERADEPEVAKKRGLWRRF